jgi:tetratricopeptide (TPR) repeat protein
LCEQQRHPDQALDHAQQALEQYRAAGHPPMGARALNSVGWYHSQLGDHTQALTHCGQALTVLQQLSDRYWEGEAATWDSLGYAHEHLGHHAEAMTCYQHALDLIRDLGDRYYEAHSLTRLGDTHRATGNPAAARTAWQRALTTLTDLDHADADAVRTKLHDVDRHLTRATTLARSEPTPPG